MLKLSRKNAVDLDKLKQDKILELDEQCTQTIYNGFYSSALGDKHLYRFLEQDQTNFNQQISLLILDETLNAIYWKTEDAGVLLHTREQFLAVVKDASLHKQGHIARYWQLKSIVLNATTVEEINSIMW